MKAAFVGGSQALRLALAYLRSDGTRDACWMPHAAVGSAENVEALRSADKIVWLGVGGLPLDFETHEIGAEFIHLPELHLDFLWPFAGQPHIANTPDEFHPFPNGPFPADLGDAWLNRALEGPRGAPAIVQAYLALDVARVVDLVRMRDLALAAQAERDKLIGVDFASRIAESFRQRPLFLSPRTPGPEMFDWLAQAAFARLGIAYAGEAPTSSARELPIHPSVAAHFGLDWARGQVCRQGWVEAVDFAEYVRRYLAYAEGPQLERGLAMLAKGRLDEAAQTLEIAVARPMGRRSLSAQRGFARASLLLAGVKANEIEFAVDLGDPHYQASLAAFARGNWREAQSALLAYLAGATGKAEDFERLADIREKLADAQGAFAALELAAGLKPNDGALAARLTLALAARGDWLAAARSAEHETALAPSNPHPRAVLADMLSRAGWASRAARDVGRALDFGEGLGF